MSMTPFQVLRAVAATIVLAAGAGLAVPTGCACIEMRPRLARAKTASEEAEAFRTISNCPQLYSVEFSSREGHPLGGGEVGEKWCNVGTIVIEWSCGGGRMRHELRDPANLQFLLRQ